MLSLRTHLLICGGLFVLLLLAAPAMGVAHSLIGEHGPYRYAPIAVMGAILLAFAFSAIPVMVKLVLGAQKVAGTDHLPVVKAALSAEAMVVWVIWVLMALGLAIAIPAAIGDGAFKGG